MEKIATFRQFHDQMCEVRANVMAVLSLAEDKHEHVVVAMSPIMAIWELILDKADQVAGPDSHDRLDS